MDNEKISKILGKDFNSEAYKLIVHADDAYQEGSLNTALDLYNKAIDLDSSNWYPFYMKGNVKEDSKKYDEAIKNYEASIELDDSYPSYFRIGLCYLFQENFQKAVKYFNSALDKFVKNDLFIQKHIILSNRANCFLRLNEFNKAIEDCNDAIRLAPSYPNSYSNRAIAYIQTGKTKEALNDLNKANDLGDPKAGQLINFLKSKM